MRDSLFRAAQQGNYFPMEEVVGQFQDRGITEDMYRTSFLEVPLETTDKTPDEPRLILWPYPRGTADCIDRANCTDDFLRSNPHFRVITELGLKENSALSSLDGVKEDVVIFAPFEVIIPELTIDDGYLAFRGRRGHVMLNELSLGYLHRKGLVNLEVSEQSRDSGTVLAELPQLLTHFINGTRLALFKGLQMAHFQRLQEDLKKLGVEPINHQIIYSKEQLLAAAVAMLRAGMDVVIRPFSASQGTGVAFLTARNFETTFEDDIEKVLTQIKQQVRAKYGYEICYPLTLSPFVESTKIRDCVTDLRIFVVYDPNAGGLRSVPGMVRVAQVPLRKREKLDASCAATNLNVPKAQDAVPGPRVFPLANDEVLGKIGITREQLFALGQASTRICGEAVALDKGLQFAYGSMDFVIRNSNRTAVPIEMNGSNVGSHPAVHPEFLDVFGKSTTNALEKLGIKDKI